MILAFCSEMVYPPRNICMCEVSCSVMSDSLQPHRLQPARLLCPWNFTGKNTGMGCHFFFQTQGSNPCLLCLLHWQVDSLPLSHLGTPDSILYLYIIQDFCDNDGLNRTNGINKIIQSNCFLYSLNLVTQIVKNLPAMQEKVKVTQQCLTLYSPMDYTQSVEFSRLKYWSGQPFPSTGDFPSPGIKLRSFALQVDSLPAEPPGKPNC